MLVNLQRNLYSKAGFLMKIFKNNEFIVHELFYLSL